MHDTTKTFCQCDKCRKFGTIDGKYSFSNVFHKFSALVAKRVKKRNPDAKLMTWMYSSYRPYSKAEYPADIIGSYCIHNRCYVHCLDDPQCVANKGLYENFRKWRKDVPNTYLREYIACSHNGYCPFEYILAKDLKLLKRIGALGWADEVMPVNGRMTPGNAAKSPDAPFMWLSNWQMYYVAAKLLWNINLDADKLLSQAYDIYYGKAAAVMKKYQALRRRLWKNAPGHAWYPGPQLRSGYCLTVPGAEKKLKGYLAEAKTIAAQNPFALQNIAMDQEFLKKYWENNAKKVRNIMSAEKKIIPVKTNGKIVIDGNLTEDAWLKARPVTGFLTIRGGQLPREKTNVRVLYDKDNLYVGFVAGTEKTWGGKLKAKAAERDGKVWEDDSIEILLAPPNKSGDFYHFMVNTRGVVYDAVMNGPGRNTAYDAQAEFKIKKHENNYVYEIRLPLKPMKTAIAPGQIWKMNFVRNCRSLQPPNMSETSTPDGTWPHNRSSYRLAVFGKNIVNNGNFAVLGKYPKEIDGLADQKFPKYWGISSGHCTLKKNKTGNVVSFNNGTIYSYIDISRASTPASLDISITASGQGKMHVRLWTWLYNKANYLERVESKKTKLPSFKLGKEPKTFSFKYNARANAVGYVYIYVSGGQIDVSDVSVVKTIKP
jgi:hypothetical protein